jgi:molybdopterin biosynthesis enzyme
MAVSIEEARAAVLEHAEMLGSDDVFLDDALGRALAVDASAPTTRRFAASAIDGFAIRAADTIDGSASFTLIGEAKAGTGPAPPCNAAPPCGSRRARPCPTVPTRSSRRS